MLWAVENLFQGALRTDDEIDWLRENGYHHIAEQRLSLSRDVGLNYVSTPSNVRGATAQSRPSPIWRSVIARRGCAK